MYTYDTIVHLRTKQIFNLIRFSLKYVMVSYYDTYMGYMHEEVKQNFGQWVPIVSFRKNTRFHYGVGSTSTPYKVYTK